MTEPREGVMNACNGAGLVVALMGLVVGQGVAAQEDPWTLKDKAELSVVWTGGNASSSTFGVKNTLLGTGGPSKLKIEAGGIRTESTVKTRTANGTAQSFTVNEVRLDQLTAESYFARGRYDYTMAPKTFLFAGTGWDRNTFSGIEHRVSFVAGAGAQWSETDDFTFRTDLGATYTIQNNVATGPLDRFAGLRFSWDLSRQLTGTTTWDSQLMLDENLKNTDDLRFDLQNAVSVAMSERLALKAGLQMLFDNDPSFIDVPLFTGGVDTGTLVPAQLKKLDTIFTVALVINVR